MGKFKVSHSKVKKWRTCHKSYYYAYIEKLRKKRKKRPLMFGSIVHEMIEADINKEDPWKILADYKKKQGEMFKEEIEEYGDIIEDTRLIMTEFFNSRKKDGLGYLLINGKKAEHEFEVEIAKDIIIIGKIDAIARRKRDKTLWVGEHKTFGQLPSYTERWKSVQVFIYDHIINLMGWGKIDGVYFNYIKSASPTRPKLTQKGEIARINSIATLPLVFKEFLKEQNLQAKDYKDTLKRLEKYKDDYFQCFFLPINRKTEKLVIDDFVTTSYEIAERGEIDHTRNIGRHCNWCEFRDLCDAELSGSDVDFVKEREYAKKDKKDDQRESKTKVESE